MRSLSYLSRLSTRSLSLAAHSCCSLSTPATLSAPVIRRIEPPTEPVGERSSLSRRSLDSAGASALSTPLALQGFYWTPSLQLLIYEFVSGGTLYKHLHEGSTSNALSWRERFDLILGMAKSLAHLHRLNITHYNLKSSNVLIDGNGEPKIGDYGLAKLLSMEVVTGRRPVEYMEDDMVVLCDVVRGALEGGRVEECIDGRLFGEFPPEEAVPMMKLGLICTSQVSSNLELIRCPQESQGEELG